MFFPVKRTLGYSHGLILFVPFYESARLFFDPLIADNAALLAVLVTGPFALFVLLRHSIGTTFVESLALTAFFATSRSRRTSTQRSWHCS